MRVKEAGRHETLAPLAGGQERDHRFGHPVAVEGHVFVGEHTEGVQCGASRTVRLAAEEFNNSVERFSIANSPQPDNSLLLFLRRSILQIVEQFGLRFAFGGRWVGHLPHSLLPSGIRLVAPLLATQIIIRTTNASKYPDYSYL